MNGLSNVATHRQAGDLYEYQRKAILHQLYHDESMLWLGMSLGKTVITLSTIEHRIRSGQVKKVLVFGPVRVIHAVWEKEARKWDHTKHLTFSIIGWPNAERRLRGLFSEADIYLCNYENMGWLSNVLDHYYLSQGKPLPFEMVVYDEISRCKNTQTMRIRGGNRTLNRGKPNERTEHVIGWRKIIPHFKYRTGLTGTPASNGYLDLHGQFLCVDNGRRLTKFITHYRNAYFVSDYMGYNYTPTEIGRRAIERNISDITLEMKTEDYIELPPMIFNDIEVELPYKVREKYEEVERDMFTQLDNGTEVELFNRASVSNKCLQFSNGSPYYSPGEPEWFELHDTKLQALDSIIEEAAGQPVAVSYLFKSDAQRIMRRYKALKPVNATDVKANKIPKLIEDWQQGRIKLLIGHPASMGHGLDGLQDRGDIVVWFGLNWSLELYDQMNTRFMRQGRDRPLTIHRILTTNTVDMAVKDALEHKRTSEEGLKAAIKRYRDAKENL